MSEGSRRYSPAIQDYLKMILTLEEAGLPASNQVLAERLSVAPASVTGMLRRLAELRLIIYAPYKGADLTNAGRKVAVEVLRHHRLLETYLAEALGFSWDQVHPEAERLEHVISEEFEDRLFELLGRPTHDPHGDPIPDRDGTFPVSPEATLATAKAGAAVVVSRVATQEPEILRYLTACGLVIGAEVSVLEQVPHDGPVRVRAGGAETSLDRELASRIRVQEG